MKKVELKTNIMCGSCIANATPVLDEKLGKGKWKVDTANPKKILTIEDENVSEEQVIEAVKESGYKAERLS